MLERKIMNELLKWKEKDTKKALIISGARQIGKTYIIDELGKKYESYISLNFLENVSYKQIFSGDLNIDTLLMNISISIKDVKFIPGKTLILFDEVQECPEAITSLKFWTRDGRFDVIATGSALGMDYNMPTSYPVGYVEYLDMYSLDFEEFLWAIGVEKEHILVLKKCFEEKKVVPELLHQKMMENLRLYMVIGGMPEVVAEYVNTKNLSEVDKIQRRIYRDYLNDIARFAIAENKIKSQKCYMSIPFQLSKENHKFQYKLVENKGTVRKFENSIDWLVSAHLVQPVYHTPIVEFPLDAYCDTSNFRLYPTDIGLLICTYDFELKRSIIEDKNLEDLPHSLILKSAKGGLYEALAADLLIKNNHKKIYFYSPVNNSAEIEFIITNSDGVIPIEIKAGRKGTASLDSLLKKGKVAYGYKMASQNVGIFENKITMPLYMMMFL